MHADPRGSGQVAIDGRATVRRHVGGVERFAREMARRLPDLRSQRYRLLAPPPGLAHRAGHVWEQVALPILAARCQLLYCPANLAPVASFRVVVVIHDAAPFRYPEAYSRTYVAYQRSLLPVLARRARMVITVSEFSRQELIDALDLAPERISVVPEGVDERFGAHADSERARRRYGLTRPYVLAVATDSRRKNLPVLEAASAALRAEGVDVVLAGSGRSYLRETEIALRRLGYVPDADLPGLYAGARAFVLPSLYEGFGLPCLEAMACGTPVVAADAGALPETLAGAGLLADPHDPAAFTAALLRAIGDGELRSRLIAAGHRRARELSWERTARRTDDLLGQLLAGS